MRKIIFVNSHPIQYFAPLYKYMYARGVELEAWYGSDNSLNDGLDKEFGLKVKWDIPILEGYKYRFFKNISWKSYFLDGFFGLINPGMIVALFNIPSSIIVVHGWHHLTHFAVIVFAKLAGHTLCFRSETPLIHESKNGLFKRRLKKIFLKYFIFRRIDFFLFIGKQNKLFYKSYGVADSQLISCPYAVDNDRFNILSLDKKIARSQLNIPEQASVILFCAKYIDKKRPLDLLRAFKNIANKNCWLIMVGEGKLREEMENFIREHNLANVILTGFVNQSSITQYYAISDVFVMCSTIGETWGLSVNEAMNYNLPVIISDLTGCADDLVVNGVNGYTFETGNVDELTSRLIDVLFLNKLSWSTSSLEIIEKYSYKTIIENLRTIV